MLNYTTDFFFLLNILQISNVNKQDLTSIHRKKHDCLNRIMLVILEVIHVNSKASQNIQI